MFELLVSQNGKKVISPMLLLFCIFRERIILFVNARFMTYDGLSCEILGKTNFVTLCYYIMSGHGHPLEV